MTKLTEVNVLLAEAEENNWGIVRKDNQIVFASPREAFMEPRLVTVTVDGDHLSIERNKHFVATKINWDEPERNYPIAGGGAAKVIKNIDHPLRAFRFFELTDKNDRDLCDPFDIPCNRLRAPRIRGYFPWKAADFLSIKLLGIHPANVFGPEAWLECEKKGWH